MMRKPFPMMKLGRTLGAVAIVAGAAAMATSFGAPSGAAPRATMIQPVEHALTYNFYIAGLKVAKAKFRAKIDGGYYSAVTTGKTTGVAALFFGSRVESSGGGSLKPTVADAEPGLAPELFEAFFEVKEKEMSLRIAYDGDAPGTVEAAPPFKKKSYEIDPRAQKGALDPMSSIVAAFMPVETEDGVCSRRIPVFDGRKRFDVTFDEVIDAYEEDGDRYVECSGTYRRLGGYKAKHMTPERRQYPFKIRFRVNDLDAPVPVRIWADTDYGTGVALLRE